MAVLKERTLSTALFVQLPVQEEIDRGFKECCYEHIVLADLSSTKPERNDYSGFFFLKQTPLDDCDFILIEEDATEHTITDDTFGTLTPFGDYPENNNLKVFVVDWKKVLGALGAQNYQIKKEMIVGGVAVDILSNTFTLKPYSTDNANYTVRWDIVMNGYIKRLGIDFKKGNFQHSMRFRGFFGNNDPEFEFRKSVHKAGNKQVENYIRKKNIWVVQSNRLPACVAKELMDFFTYGTEQFMTDYNSNNFDYDLSLVPVAFVGNDGIDYNSQIRDVVLNLKFEDRHLTDEKFNC